MAVTSTYYLNAPSLGSATCVFTDASLTTVASNGFYSDGAISRELVDGVLLPEQACPSCVAESYNCVEGVCIDPGDGTGMYPTLVDCQEICGIPPVSYNCVEGVCVDPGDGTGTYASLGACETACGTPPAYNYYTFTPCAGGASVDYRSILSLALSAVYTFASYPPDRLCYQITSITASPNTNDLPTIYGPLSDCSDANCIQP